MKINISFCRTFHWIRQCNKTLKIKVNLNEIKYKSIYLLLGINKSPKKVRKQNNDGFLLVPVVHEQVHQSELLMMMTLLKKEKQSSMVFDSNYLLSAGHFFSYEVEVSIFVLVFLLLFMNKKAVIFLKRERERMLFTHIHKMGTKERKKQNRF